MLLFMSFLLYSLFFFANKHFRFSLAGMEGSFTISSANIPTPLDNPSLLRGFSQWIGILPIREFLETPIVLETPTKEINYKKGIPVSYEWLVITNKIGTSKNTLTILSSGEIPISRMENPYEIKEWLLASHWRVESYKENEYLLYKRIYKGVLQGFLGESLTYQKSNLTLIKEKLPITFLIGLITFFLSYPLSILLGYLLSLSGGRKKHLKSFCYLIFSLPNILLGIFLLWLFSWKLKWFPLQALPWWEIEENPKNFFYSIINPILTLSIPLLITNSLNIAKRLEESFSEPFLLYAKAKGLSPFQIAKNHLLKISLAPLISQSKQIFILLVSGSIVVEHIFGIAGMGNLSINALLNNDLMLALSLAFLIGSIQILGQLVMEGIFTLCYPYSHQ